MANAKLGRRTEAWDWMRKLRDAPELAQAIRAQPGLPASNSAPASKPSYPVAYPTLALELLYSEAFATLAPRNTPPLPGLPWRTIVILLSGEQISVNFFLFVEAP